MAVELVTIYSGSIASGAATSTVYDVEKSWTRIYAEVSTMSTNAELQVYASSDGSIWRPCYDRNNAASALSTGLLTINLTVVANLLTSHVITTAAMNAFNPIQAGYRYYQLKASAVISGGAKINLICNDA